MPKSFHALAFLAVLGFLIAGLSIVSASSPHVIDLPLLFGPPVGASPVPSPTVTPTQEPPGGDVTVTGTIVEASTDPPQGIVGATVSILSCLGGRRFAGTSGPGGSFSFLVPGLYLDPCVQVTIEAWADGYQTYIAYITPAALRANPVLEIALTPGSMPTATPQAGDVILSGQVTVAESLPVQPIEGAVIAAIMCQEGRRFSDTSDSHGAYRLRIPADQAAPCSAIHIEVRATGYEMIAQEVSPQSLRQQPQRSYALWLAQDPIGEDLRLTGLIYDREDGEQSPVAGAVVSMMTCSGSDLYQASSGTDGTFVLDLPGTAISPCASISIEIWAEGYQVYMEMLDLADLYQNPHVDIALDRTP